MNKKQLKRIAKGTISVVAILTLVLCVHIYMVTRPKAPDAGTVALARIDVHQDIDNADAEKIGSWLSSIKGVDHYLCNTQSNIVVFSFRPAVVNANDIAKEFREKLHYNSTRYLPTESELKGGCPVAATSISYKAYHFIKHVF